MKHGRKSLGRCMLAATILAGGMMTSQAQQQPLPTTSQAFRPPIVLDAHVDVLLRLVNPQTGRSLAEPGWRGQVNFENWRAGGTNAVMFAVWVDPRQFPCERAVQRADQLIGVYHQQLQMYPNILVHCDTSDDVRRAVASGKIAGMLGLEGGIAINNDLANIERFRRMGVRYMTLTHSATIDWADDMPRLS